MAQPRCEPTELFVKTPEGGNLVTGVSITRDGDGFVDTKWATTLAVGTTAQIYLHSESRKHADEGPLLDGAGDSGTACDGKFITHLSKFSNKGSGFNGGLYFLDLTIVDSDQPSATHNALASAAAKLKAVSRFGSTLMFELFPEFELPNCSRLPQNESGSRSQGVEVPRLSRSQLEESFRLMVLQNSSCFNHVKTTWTHYHGEYVLAGATMEPKDWCAAYLSRLDFTSENKKADDWVTENSASLNAAKITHVNLFYCTDSSGRSCHFQHAIDVK